MIHLRHIDVNFDLVFTSGNSFWHTAFCNLKTRLPTPNPLPKNASVVLMVVVVKAVHAKKLPSFQVISSIFWQRPNGNVYGKLIDIH